MQIGWSWREKIFEETNLKLDHHLAIRSRSFNVGGRLMCTRPFVIEVVWDRLLLWRTGIALDCHCRRYCKIALRQRQRVRGRMFFFVFVVVNCIAFCISRSILFVFFVTFVTFSKYCKLHGASGNILGEECFCILYFSLQFVLHCQNIANYTEAAATC